MFVSVLEISFGGELKLRLLAVLMLHVIQNPNIRTSGDQDCVYILIAGACNKTDTKHMDVAIICFLSPLSPQELHVWTVLKGSQEKAAPILLKGSSSQIMIYPLLNEKNPNTRVPHQKLFNSRCFTSAAWKVLRLYFHGF